MLKGFALGRTNKQTLAIVETLSQLKRILKVKKQSQLNCSFTWTHVISWFAVGPSISVAVNKLTNVLDKLKDINPALLAIRWLSYRNNTTKYLSDFFLVVFMPAQCSISNKSYNDKEWKYFEIKSGWKLELGMHAWCLGHVNNQRDQSWKWAGSTILYV